MIKRIIIMIASLLLVFSCGNINNENRDGNSTEHRKSVPRAKIIGYNPYYLEDIYLLEAEGHTFVIYGEDIEVLE